MYSEPLTITTLRPDDLSLNARGGSSPNRSTNILSPSASNVDNGHSPAMNLKLTFPKRQYSVQRDDSLLRVPTPVFSRAEIAARKKGPSSRGTVLSMAGLFIVGVTLVLSGIIVLIQHTETAFIITGCIFVGIGLLMVLVCAILQRKNVVKFVKDLDRDFLKMSDNIMWKHMFNEAADEDHVASIVG